MHLVFHGETIARFGEGFASLLDRPVEISYLPEVLRSEPDRHTYASADAIVSFRFNRELPASSTLRLLHVPGAGLDEVDFTAVPASAVVCNCFGHEQAIAEYVFAALLSHVLPLTAADAALRQGDWSYRAGLPDSVHGELATSTIGLLGFGRIGRAIATRAKAFEMTVHVANRSPVPRSDHVDRSYSLAELPAFFASADAFVVSLPLTPETEGLVGDAAFRAMRPHAVVVNVGRGRTIDEAALYDALATRRIASAIIDTWYRYPSASAPRTHPSALPFHTLDNIVMTPHMSAWTHGTIRRRQRAIADNLQRRFSGRPCLNVVWPIEQVQHG